MTRTFTGAFICLSVLAAAALFSCGPAVSSSSVAISTTVGMKMKSYLGSASIGDLVIFTIDDSNKQVVFTNLTRNYNWSSAYTDNGDGTASFTMPFNVPGKFVEIPGKAVALSIKILNDVTLVPALAVLAPNVIGGPADMTNVPGIYGQLMNTRDTNAGLSYGTYHIEMGAVMLSATNWSYYERNYGPSGPFSNDMTGILYYSNSAGMPYSYGSNAGGSMTVPFVANGSTYVADLGYNAGFSFGLSCRTNSFTAAVIAGTYVCMVLEQRRDSNTLTLDTNYTAPMFFKLSNVNTNLMVYSSTSNGNYTNLSDVLLIDYVPGSVDFKMPNFYYMISTNMNSYGVPTVILPSSDLQYGCVGSWAGYGTDTNSTYHALMGFFKKIQ